MRAAVSVPVRVCPEEGMTDHSISNPQARRTANRRKTMKSTWQTKAWKQAVQRNARLRAAKRRHPCTFRTVTGKCQKSTFGAMCPYAASKALEHCDEAIAKKGVKV